MNLPSAPARFANRRHAGRLLGQRLTRWANREDVVVLALPRGGVPVGYEVARLLKAPLDVLVVRKLRVPGHPDLPMGALASGKVCILNTRVIDFYRVPRRQLEELVRREQGELHIREQAYRGARPPLAIPGRTVILVDDGMATGMTMSAAVKAVRGSGASQVLVAVPVASREARDLLSMSADDVICLETLDSLDAVADGYSGSPAVFSDAQARILMYASGEPRTGGETSTRIDDVSLDAGGKRTP